MHISKEMSKWK